jgi:hypothetical protein
MTHECEDNSVILLDEYDDPILLSSCESAVKTGWPVINDDKVPSLSSPKRVPTLSSPEAQLLCIPRKWPQKRRRPEISKENSEESDVGGCRCNIPEALKQKDALCEVRQAESTEWRTATKALCAQAILEQKP